jgi:hypothetical protein
MEDTAGNPSIGFYLSTAFDYEIRNRIDIDIARLQNIDELNEAQTDELQILTTVKEYLTRRKGEIKP